MSCGHCQHVRHEPPFVNRPWVTTEEGRSAKLGEALDCPRCDRSELPDGLSAYRRTPEFDETTLPVGLRRAHATKAGVWAEIRVIEGILRLRMEGSREEEWMLDSSRPGIVAPEVPHHVEPIGSVRFFVEFYKRS